MAQSNYTPIQLYRTSTAAAAPTAGNLAAGELAINLTDEKLYFKNAAGTVKTLASSGASTVGGSNTQVQFNSSGTLAGSANFVFDGTNVGIGTASPAGKLHVSGGEVRLQGTASFYSFYDTAGTTRSGYIQNNAGSIALVGELAQPMTFWTNNTERMRIISDGRMLVGTSTSPNGTAVSLTLARAGDNGLNLAYNSGAGGGGSLGTITGAGLAFYTYTGVVGSESYSERMRIDSSGNVGIGVVPSASTTFPALEIGAGNCILGGSGFVDFTSNSFYNGSYKYKATGAASYYEQTGGQHIWYNAPSGTAGNTISFVEAARLTTAGYLEAVYSDEVVALGNSGTATTINLNQGNVFTATLTGNCTFTLANSNANSNRGSSFTLILTNDGTAGRTVAWAGGTFRFPGGAAALSRTTTANAVDIWVFFTPNNGTTWYGNISMKNMIA